MKKAILTFGLFTMMMVLTSFTSTIQSSEDLERLAPENKIGGQQVPKNGLPFQIGGQRVPGEANPLGYEIGGQQVPKNGLPYTNDIGGQRVPGDAKPLG